MTTSITLTPMQGQAVNAIKQWYRHSDKKIFHLAGYAGTGKSTLVDYVIQELNIPIHRVAFACYTGKASLVLTRKAKGKFQAQTNHRLIYKLDKNTEGNPTFIRKSRDELSGIDLIVNDEWSMVDGKTFEDLKYFGIKMLLIGDQGQLPPVSKANNEELEYIRSHPDFSLTEIHRQAEGNPIIYLSMLARTKQPIPYGLYGDGGEVLVINPFQWQSVKEECYTTADQIICGYNRTRQGLNQDIRKYLGFHDVFPQVNDKLICTRNNWGKSIRDISLVNGMTGFVKNIKYHVAKSLDVRRDAMEIQFRPDFTDECFHNLYLVKDHFTGKEYKLLPHEHSTYCEFDYGYAITGHKSQGSQWDKVVVINEVLRAEEHHRWLYTTITRSSEKLVLVI